MNESKERDFIYASGPEPHSVRRVEILEKHPEIKQLFGYEWRTKYMVAGTVLLQLSMAWVTLEWSWPAFIAVAYVVGATANHSLFLAVHELAHNLGAQRPEHNKLIGFLANLPIAIPYSATFKPYHMDHHRYQGQHETDADVPTYLEGYVITKSAFGYVDHTVRKAIFMFFQIFAYALRPMIVKPSLVPLDRWIVANWCTTFAFDALVLATLGPKALLYLILSSFFAGSIHPTAGHFIAEHYVMEGTTETYSYYGPLNWVAYNVGYHNEHHDFPSIPWSRLPMVREIAPEYYDNLPQCKSWPGVLLRYIFDDSISPFSRVKRVAKKAN
eukprot:TRINITY_DN4456_c0_g1_i4.p1 TRINITY_DN4456_c0_g1~~TRINITY_DN4456_c0_g1_i4.p1  ORF type:complete len:349 (+),score=43.14 TRINITY_DN4456_c0_g1_i4:64-1047(+)